MHSKRRIVLVVAAACLLLALGAVWVLWPRRSLAWTANDGTRFVVTVDVQSIHTMSYLAVTRDGRTQRVRMDDDAMLATVRLVHYQTWLLVVNDDLVLGGYNFDGHELLGENQWAQLPLTRWQGEGQVVARGRFGKIRTAPVGFPG
ncbi:MAG: hypothetical protein PVJ57_10405 [Phycisphaerae bacterium]|jgi:hypothetical protein